MNVEEMTGAQLVKMAIITLVELCQEEGCGESLKSMVIEGESPHGKFTIDVFTGMGDDVEVDGAEG